MKLLNCLNCAQIISISKELTVCKCSKSSAQYLEDNLTVTYKGPCRILGILNEQYNIAKSRKLINGPDDESNWIEFKWFVIKEGFNIKREDKKYSDLSIISVDEIKSAISPYTIKGFTD